MTAFTVSEQTVNWADPATQNALTRLHRADLLRGTQVYWLVPPLLLYAALTRGVDARGWTGMAGLVALAAVMFWSVRRRLQGLREAAQASGVTTYRLNAEGVLHIQNALGSFQIPLSVMGRARSSPAGLIVPYAGQSLLTLPDGPLRRDLERRLKHSRSTAPGGTP